MLLLFEKGGYSALHTGDFRASNAVRDQLCEYFDAATPPRKLDVLYLDTTYAERKATFPPQEVACATVARLVRSELQRDASTLFVCDAYSLGKENAFDAAIKASGGRGFVPSRRLNSTNIGEDSTFIGVRERGETGVWAREGTIESVLESLQRHVLSRVRWTHPKVQIGNVP